MQQILAVVARMFLKLVGSHPLLGMLISQYTSQWVCTLVRWVWRYYAISHDDVIKWKHFPRYWPFVRRIHRSPVNSPHKGQWRGALMFTLICTRINGWVNNCEAGDLRRNRAHYDVIVMGHIAQISNLGPLLADKIGEIGCFRPLPAIRIIQYT